MAAALYRSLDVASNTTSRSQYRSAANYESLIELDELRRTQRAMIDDVRRTFERRRRQWQQQQQNGVVNDNQDDDVESPSASGECDPLQQSDADNTVCGRLLPGGLYQRPVCIRGQTATYPSPLHAVLAQYAADWSAVNHDDHPPTDHPQIAPTMRDVTETDCDDKTSEGNTPPPTVSWPTTRSTLPLLLDRRLVDVRRSASFASVSSSEGYCSGTETDSIEDFRSQSRTGSDADVDRRSPPSSDDDLRRTAASPIATAVTSSSSSSSAAAAGAVSAVRCRQRSTKRRLCKMTRRLVSPLATSDDDVFTYSDCFNQRVTHI